MKLKLKPKGREKVRIRLTDEQGGQMEFESIKAAAEFLDVSSFAVMYASRMGSLCRGCSVERVAKPDVDGETLNLPHGSATVDAETLVFG